MVVGFLLTKGAVILKALMALKYAKFLITAVTMSISALLYGFAFGSWYFAVGLVLLLLVHEYGHVIAMWKKGIKASAPVFIPFLGALIYAKIPDDKKDEAYIGYVGPLIGTVGAMVCIEAAFAFEAGSFWSVLLHILGNVGLFINIFNLIPTRPLDGGRILHPLGKGVVYYGFTLLLILAYAMNDICFVLIALLSTEDMPIRRFVRNMLWGIFGVTWAAEFYFSPFQGSWLLRVLIVVLLGLSLSAFRSAWKTRFEPLPPVVGDSNDVSFGVKMKWLTCYVILLAFIGGTMVWHTQHMPKEVRESSLMKFVHEF